MSNADPSTEQRRMRALARLLAAFAQDMNILWNITGNYATFASRVEGTPRVGHLLGSIQQAADIAQEKCQAVRQIAAGRAPADVASVLSSARERRGRRRAAFESVVQDGCPGATIGAGLEGVIATLCAQDPDDTVASRVDISTIVLSDDEADGWPLQRGDYIRVLVSPIRAGADLDLATAYAEACRGALRVPAGHACIEVLLPAEPLSPERAQPELVRGHGERVIVADGPLHEFTTELLNAHGYDAIGTDSPEQVLELLDGTEERCDLLVTEVNFCPPHMQGGELVRRVLRLRPQARILFQGGWSPADNPHSAWAAQLPSVYKPYLRSEFLSAVDAALRGPPPSEA